MFQNVVFLDVSKWSVILILLTAKWVVQFWLRFDPRRLSKKKLKLILLKAKANLHLPFEIFNAFHSTDVC